MKVQVQCFSIKVVPYSVKTESHIVTVPAPGKFASPESKSDDFEDEEARETAGRL